MASPPRSMLPRAIKVVAGGSPPTRGRGVSPPASMTSAGKPLTPVARVQPTVDRTVQKPMKDSFTGGDR